MSFKSWLAGILGVRPEIKYQIIEVPVLKTRSGWTREERESVATLTAHPGFVSLSERLAFQAQALKTKLAFERHKELRDVEFLQSGIYWCNWLQQQVASSTTRLAIRKQEAAEEDLAAIQELQATYEKVGNE